MAHHHHRGRTKTKRRAISWSRAKGLGARITGAPRLFIYTPVARVPEREKTRKSFSAEKWWILRAARDGLFLISFFWYVDASEDRFLMISC